VDVVPAKAGTQRRSQKSLGPRLRGDDGVMKRYSSFAEFYPFYLSEHSRPATRRLHFVGSSLALGCVLAAFVSGNLWWLAGAVVAGYGLAWIGHAFVEHNRPATFTHPLYSFLGDWVMFKEMLTGRIPW
jgi:hypothetical protein